MATALIPQPLCVCVCVCVNKQLISIPGIVETGLLLFVGFAVKAFFGSADGAVQTRTNRLFEALQSRDRALPEAATAATASVSIPIFPLS